MKMNLSVVMQTIDKMSAPLKKMTSNQDHYTKKINAAKKAMKDTTGYMAQIQSLKKLQQNHIANNLAINTANERIKRLNDLKKKNGKLTAAQTQQLNAQKAKLSDLNATRSEYLAEMKKTGGALKKAGINTKNLTKSENKLQDEYTQTAAKLKTLQQRYSGVKKVTSALNQVNSKLSMPSLNQVKNTAIGVAGLAATVKGYMGMVNSAAGEMDHLAKTAGNLKMPVEELQAMQSQAEHAGVSAETMEASLIRFTRRLGVLQTTGSGALGGFLKQSKNPIYKELQAAETTQEAYEKLLDSFSQLKTNQEKMAFADAAFGDSGRRMLILLEEGTQGLTAAREEFIALGGGASTEDTKTAEAYNDAWQKISEAMRSIRYAALAPVMRELTDIFNEFITNFKNADWRADVLKQVRETMTGAFHAIKAMGAAIVFVSQNLPELLAGLAALKYSIAMISALILANPLGVLISGISLVVVGLAYWLNKIGLLKPALESLWTVVKRVFSGIAAIITPMVRAFVFLIRGLATIGSILPGSVGDSLKTAASDLEALDKRLEAFGENSMKYAFTGEASELEKLLQLQKEIQLTKSESPLVDLKSEFSQTGSKDILTAANVKSSSQVDINIHSDKPVEIASVETDRNTGLNINTAPLLIQGY